MRSKNANEFIENYNVNDYSEVKACIKAVELAEEEMRENSIDAFKKCCPFYLTEICMEDKSPCDLYCSELQQFIELLDKTE